MQQLMFQSHHGPHSLVLESQNPTLGDTCLWESLSFWVPVLLTCSIAATLLMSLVQLLKIHHRLNPQAFEDFQN